MTRLTAKESTLILKAQSMKETGFETSSMVAEQKPGKTGQSIQVNTSTGRSKVKAGLSGVMGPLTTETSILMTSQASESMNGKMDVPSKVSGRPTKCAARESSPGLMVEFTEAPS